MFTLVLQTLNASTVTQKLTFLISKIVGSARLDKEIFVIYNRLRNVRTRCLMQVIQEAPGSRIDIAGAVQLVLICYMLVSNPGQRYRWQGI